MRISPWHLGQASWSVSYRFDPVAHSKLLKINWFVADSELVSLYDELILKR
jgi:hypothetical protein